MAIRTAMGASRGRLARQLLTESLLLALLGGAAGCLLASWGVDALIAGVASSIPRASEIRLDGRVLAFTALASFLTGILFGLAPCWQAGRVTLQHLLKEERTGLSASKQRTRSALAIAEMALALILLIGAGLLLRSYYHLNQVRAGFDYEQLMSFSLTLPAGKYKSPEQQTNFYSDLIRKLSALPGVQSVGLASGLPFGASSWRTPFVVEGSPTPPPGQEPLLDTLLVSPDYFRTMGIPLRAGRYFSEQDNRQHLAGRDLSGLNEGAQRAAGVNTIIIDEEFARRHWPNENAIGKRIRLAPVDPGSPTLTVVGIVGRVKMDKLSIESNRAQAYFSYLQLSFSNMTVVIKSPNEPAQMIAAARRQIQEIEPHQPIYNIRTLEQIRTTSIVPERLNLMLLGLFALLALILAAIGLYGVMAFSVAQCTREIGIRMALGAQRSDVIKLIVQQGMVLALLGLVIGLAGAFALTRVMRSLLFAVSPTDPITFVSVPLLLMAVTLLACWIPARRATKVDPRVAMSNHSI